MPDMEYSFMLEQDLITASAEDDIICAAAYAGEELAAGTFKTDFQRTSFTSCRFAGCDFSGSSFFDTSFTNCDFSNSRFSGCYFKNCSMNGCKGDGCDFSQSTFIASVLEKGTYCYGNFSNTLWKDSSIVQAKFCMAYLSDSKFKKLKFEDRKSVV